MTGTRPARPGLGERMAALVPRALALLLLAAALVRIAGLLGPGHGGDLQAFLDWAEGTAEHGLTGYYANGGTSNYPPMLYLLWPLGVALDGPELVFAIRTLSIPFDLGLGVLLFHTARSMSGVDRDGLLAAGFYLLNPAVVLVGPMWGQVDGMGALPMVGSIVAAGPRPDRPRGRAGRPRRAREAPVRDRRVRAARCRGRVAAVAGRPSQGRGPRPGIDRDLPCRPAAPGPDPARVRRPDGRHVQPVPVHLAVRVQPLGHALRVHRRRRGVGRDRHGARAGRDRRQPVAVAPTARPGRAARRGRAARPGHLLPADAGPRAVPLRRDRVPRAARGRSIAGCAGRSTS